MSDTLKTGIEPLDRELDGGIVSGSVVSLLAPPDSQSEVILERLAEERQTLYLTTTRSKQKVKRDLNESGIDTSESNIVVHSVDHQNPDQSVLSAISEVPKTANIIIDTGDIIESNIGRTDYLSYLNQLSTQVQETDSIVFIYAFSNSDSDLREWTLSLSDVVMRITLNNEGTEMKTNLSVPKYRRGEALTESIKLKLTDTVAVDTSRDIA